MVREDRRQCKKCRYAWYAVRVKPTARPSWSDTQTTRSWFHPMRQRRSRERPRAGKSPCEGMSAGRFALAAAHIKVKTVLGRVAPTALTENRNANAPAPPPTAPTQDGWLPVGTRVTLQVLGFRGKVGTITAHGEKGYTVKVNVENARWVPHNKVTPIG